MRHFVTQFYSPLASDIATQWYSATPSGMRFARYEYKANRTSLERSEQYHADSVGISLPHKSKFVKKEGVEAVAASSIKKVSTDA